jgi:hypothetical protein
MHLFNSCVIHVLSYSCKGWKYSSSSEKKLLNFENKCLCRITNTHWRESSQTTNFEKRPIKNTYLMLLENGAGPTLGTFCANNLYNDHFQVKEPEVVVVAVVFSGLNSAERSGLHSFPSTPGFCASIQCHKLDLLLCELLLPKPSGRYLPSLMG